MKKCICCGEEATHTLKGKDFCDFCYKEMRKRLLTAAFEANCF